MNKVTFTQIYIDMRKVYIEYKEIIIYIIIIAILLPCVICCNGATKISTKDDCRLLYMYRSGYKKDETNRVIIIESYKQLEDYYIQNKEEYGFDNKNTYAKGYEIKDFKAFIDNYNSEWFKDKMLLLAITTETSGAYRYRLKSIAINLTKAGIVLYREVSEEYITMDMAGWHTFIEIDKYPILLSATVSIENK